MREIKFRIWNNEEKEMIENKDIYNIDFRKDIFFSSVMVDGFILNESNYRLMQYTGLKDKNGKKIYEGDIVKCTGMIELTGVVKFKDCEFCIKYKGKYDRQFNYKSLKENEKYNDGKCSFDLKNEFEVIGNLYDNKELLNE
ncbi:yopX family protein [[Clostridium] bifermentans ATCC 638]|uniref:YopX family protein n=1 Tax=Paraclostridium bifermentans ATCC 638 = DSM 14991 TaxID=1233171 RepID=T4VGG7_PARBF|nr:YopX family protein [Paraclostridium bifermentans]EQK39767.1 yopX family protein [[Clostridium] bifermentans ATCC 638] [Paraclostridium bifermentans ATCC 638 = DSM 14991]RIZ57441.1 hypothetical protein CHH45_16520 [Paraclostridium bifermentans]